MELVTSGSISEKLSADRDAVAYALRKLGIDPVGRAGMVRIFPAYAAETVRLFLIEKDRNLQRRRSNGNGQPNAG